MNDVEAQATRLADLHESGDLVVLPTVWDTWSAGVAAEAGFAGLTVGSHPVADAIGSADGENMDFAEYLSVVRKSWIRSRSRSVWTWSPATGSSPGN